MPHITKTPTFKAVLALLKTNIPLRLTLDMTGAGAGLQKILWQVPGCSGLILNGGLPYAGHALGDLLSRRVPKSVARETAMAMAQQAFETSIEIMKAESRTGTPAGLGGTASVATEREKDGKREDRKGSDEVWVALRLPDFFLVVHVGFFKTHKLHNQPIDEDEAFRQRAEVRNRQGDQVDLIGLNLLLFAAGLPQIPLDDDLIEEGNITGTEGGCVLRPRIIEPKIEPSTLYREPVYWPDGSRYGLDHIDGKKHILFAGSFNDWHRGHAAMARACEEQTGMEVVCQLNADHPVKGMVPDDEMARRVSTFFGRRAVIVLKEAGIYLKKAALFPSVGFLVGVDTLRRLLDPNFCTEDLTPADICQRFRELGTKFYVAGRANGNRFETLRDVGIPEGYEDLFVEIKGRWDISSTAIRNSAEVKA